MSSAPLPSDEVADDYRTSLEDLITNDRYQISNLTLIAKENVEHAEAISRVLQNHIARTPPSRKLPALYVLDSVVKNVGSPYNVYFGRNLYQTFMGAYSQVDEKVRRKLEEMLRTWREPVPGSSTTTPVFPLSSTQSIVDNLTKLRAVTGLSTPTPLSQRYPQQAPVPLPSRTTPLPTYDYRSTPTPPQSIPTRPPTSQQLPSTPQPVPVPVPVPAPVSQAGPQVQPPFHSQQWQQQHPVYPQQFHGKSAPSSEVDLAKLHADIDSLTAEAKLECAAHPMDHVAQKKLSTLQNLKEILEAGTSSRSDIVDIRMSIDQQLAKRPAATAAAAAAAAAADGGQAILQVPPPLSQIPYPISLPPYSQAAQQPQYPTQPYPYSQPHTTHQTPVPVSASTPASAAAPLLTTNLAELLRQHSEQAKSKSNVYPAPGIYAQPATSAVLRSPAEPINTVTEPPIIAALRAQGLLSSTPTPASLATQTPPNGQAFAVLATTGPSFTSAFIKTAQPQMVSSFLNAKPNQCSTCGRRFTSDEQGREKKARHLDWHFKTKTRMMEAEKRGQNRSWYVDEREWISSREQDDDVGDGGNSANSNANGMSSSAGGHGKRKADQFVRVPGDPTLRNASCPIDQEPFQSEWSEELQDFIWKDAIKVGSKYYHASCFEEVTKNREMVTSPADRAATGTPDSVLGKKRKAELEPNGSTPSSAKSRIKAEVS